MKKLIVSITLLFLSNYLFCQLTFQSSEILSILGEPKTITESYLHNKGFHFKNKADEFQIWAFASDIDGDYKVTLAYKMKVLNVFSYETDQNDLKMVQEDIIKNGFQKSSRFENSGTYGYSYSYPRKNFLCTITHTAESDIIKVIYGHIK